MNTIIAGSRNIYLEYRFFIKKTNNTYQYIKIYTKTLLLFQKNAKINTLTATQLLWVCH